MRRSAGFVAAWLVATLVAITVAAAAVSSVRGEVTDAPIALGAPSLSVTTTTQAPGMNEQPPSTTLLQPDTTTTTTLPVVDTSTSTTTAPPPVATTTTAPPPVATTTTTVATTTTSSSYTKTYGDEVGLPGEVTIIVSGESVTFGGASALPGWTVELKNSGPEQVKVEFERNDDKDEEIKFTAEVEHGELEIKVSFPDDD